LLNVDDNRNLIRDKDDHKHTIKENSVTKFGIKDMTNGIYLFTNLNERTDKKHMFLNFFINLQVYCAIHEGDIFIILPLFL